MSVNGLPGNENNYSMNGADVVSYTSGMAEQSNAFAGIPIPNPDTMAEFQVQTPPYAAGFGRHRATPHRYRVNDYAGCPRPRW